MSNRSSETFRQCSEHVAIQIDHPWHCGQSLASLEQDIDGDRRDVRVLESRRHNRCLRPSYLSHLFVGDGIYPRAVTLDIYSHSIHRRSPL